MSHKLELVGRRFGKLEVLSSAGVRNNRSMWLVRCDCGQEKEIQGKRLVAGHTQTCGCSHRQGRAERNFVHGGVKTKAYRTWKHIKGRCLNPNDAAFHNYGGRGITICDEWKDDFAAFLAHVGEPKDKSLSLDRIDNNRGYEPGNVRWATREVQNSNTRRTIRVRVDGEDMNLKRASMLLGVTAGSMSYHMCQGKSFAEALKTQLKD